MPPTKSSLTLRKALLDTTISTLFEMDQVEKVHLCTLVIPDGVDEALWFAPMEHVKNGTFTINISPSAIGGFSMDLYLTRIQASFSGKRTTLEIPTGLIIGVIGFDVRGNVVAMENFMPFMVAPEESVEPANSEAKATSPFSVIDGGKSGSEDADKEEVERPGLTRVH